MKLIIFTILSTVLFVNAKVMLDEMAIKKIQETAGLCQSKTGASAAEMEKMMKHEVPDSKTGKCFLACLKKGLGFMNEDNSLNRDLIRSRMSQHIKDENTKTKALEIVDLCIKEVPTISDECEMAGKVMECCVKHSREMGIAELNILGA